MHQMAGNNVGGCMSLLFCYLSRKMSAKIQSVYTEFGNDRTASVENVLHFEF